MRKINLLEDKKLKKKKALLNRAYELFTSRGFHRTTIDAIAFKAGVSKGSFYNYFQDKEDIRDALIVAKSGEIFDDSLAALTNNGDNLPPVEKLIFIIDYILDTLSRDISLLRFISKNLSWALLTSEKTYAKNENSESMTFREFIERMLEGDGIELTKELELSIFTIIELVNSTCHTVILEGLPVTFTEYKPFLYKCIRNIFSEYAVQRA